MGNFAILRTQKLKTVQDIAGAGSHVYRLRDTPNADPDKINYSLKETRSNQLHKIVNERIEESGAKTRKDSVRAIEFLLTASPDFFKDNDNEKLKVWARENMKWLNKNYGSANVVSAVLHLDEATPHIHAHVVPITPDGRLSAKDYIGGTRQRMRDIQTDYAKAMGRFGLERGSEKSIAKHSDIKQYYNSVNLAVAQYKPVKVAGPPFLFGREEYKGKQQKQINKLRKKTVFMVAEIGRLKKQNSSREYEKLKKDRDERAGQVRLMKVAMDNEALKQEASWEDWQAKQRKKDETIESLNVRVAELAERARKAEENNKLLNKKLQQYRTKPESSPAFG